MDPEYSKAFSSGTTGDITHQPDGNAHYPEADISTWFSGIRDVQPGFRPGNADLANYGYHFCLPGGTRAYVGRTSWEHDILRYSARDDDLILQPSGMDYPVVLCHNISWHNDILLAAGILVSFSLTGAADVEIAMASGAGKKHILHGIQPIDITLLEKWKIESHMHHHNMASSAGKA